MSRPKPTPLNVLVAGIYWSGSGAVVDYLKGHKECYTPNGEFTDVKREGRVISVLTAHSQQSAKRHIQLMMVETAVGKIPSAYFRYVTGKNQRRLPLKKQWRHNLLKLKALRRCQEHIRNRGAHTDILPWQQWIRDMGEAYAPGKRAIVWNQPLWIGSHETLALEIFKPCKLIVVHRDPEDQFAEVERQGKLGKAKSDPAFSGDRSDPVAFLLDGIARKLESLVALKKARPASDILTVPFESFVLEHETMERRVCDFLGLPFTEGSGPFFNPEQSRNNVGIGKSEHIQAMLSPYRDRVERMSELRNQLNW